MKRREFNKSLIALSGIGASLSLGVIPLSVNAARSITAFEAETGEDAMNELYGTTSAEPSEAISFKAPDIAENGAVVPISIMADIPNVDHVALLVLNNPSPLAASFEPVTAGATTVGTRIKMGKTSQLMALVRADGKVYSATSKEVKVTIGGCGG
ncbi:MAG: thiosulfate oxidation carrier protein SoxY [Gammaproteobacteria bacterium]|nr:thiosulfate oxidation carrier protein SoxY [Gammaproteobacteria bacterium]